MNRFYCDYCSKELRVGGGHRITFNLPFRSYTTDTVTGQKIMFKDTLVTNILCQVCLIAVYRTINPKPEPIENKPSKKK